MPRFLRRNVALRGVQTSGTDADDLGRRHPASAAAALIIPQCIAWPFANDMYGDTMPSGIVAVRSVAQARQSVERAWSTSGDPLEGLDRWIAVPDSLPVGYTARVSRDINKGRLGTSTHSRGTPYFDVTFTDSPFTRDASDNFSASSRFTPAFGIGSGPYYRPSGGGGLAGPLAWYPMNVSDRVPLYVSRPSGISSAVSPVPGWSIAPAAAVNSASQNGSITWQRHIGWRSLKLRIAVCVQDAFWSTFVGSEFRAQYQVRHNVSGSTSGNGDTQDYLSPALTKADFTQGPPDQWAAHAGWSVYYHDAEITPAMYSILSPGSALRSMMVSWNVVLDKVNAIAANMASWGPLVATSNLSDYTYAAQFSARPRLDVPLWFSAYGAGVAAPGGVL